MGSKLTYVDLALWLKLYELGQDDGVGAGWADKLSLPRLGAFAQKIGSLPRVASYVRSQRRMPRIKRIDGDYKYVTENLVPQAFVPKLTDATATAGSGECKDLDADCGAWKDEGECDANPDYMYEACAASCGKCGASKEL